MISTLAWMSLLVFLVVAQKTIADILTFHRLTVEISLLFVLYAGFYMGIFRGITLTLLTGFLVSTLTGTVSGLYMFSYMTLFCLTSLVSARVCIEQPHLIMIFTFCLAMLEGAMLMIISRYFLGAPLAYPLLQTIIPNVFILSLISPLVFQGFRKFEAMIHDQTVQQS
jgi:rod shape-determining protein MreD